MGTYEDRLRELIRMRGDVRVSVAEYQVALERMIPEYGITRIIVDMYDVVYAAPIAVAA